jgi:hypothetical protein
MTPFDWNGLHVGDPLFVHYSPATRHRAAAGTVAFVTVVPHHDNEVGIRVAATDGGPNVVWPSWLAVHRDAVSADGTCWRCDEPASVT